MINWLNRRLSVPFFARRDGSRFLDHLPALAASQYDPPELVRRRQLDAIRELVRHADETVPFYHWRFAGLGLRPEDVRDLDDFARLPVLTKADIRENPEKLLSDQFRLEDVITKRTSGSTGVPLTVYCDRASLDWKTACTVRSNEWSGYRLGGRIAKVWGNPEYLKHGLRGRVRNFLLERATYLDTLHVGDDTLAAFARKLRRKPPGLLFGHAHSLYLFACYCDRHGISDIHPDGIIATAMPLHRWQRVVIERVFDRAVTDRYGCEEVSLIASECEVHHGLHVNADSVYLEVEPLDPADPLTGHLLVTDLTNRAMPILRYRVGDVLTLSTRACPCGRTLPMLETVQGRESDYVVTPEGRCISGISLTENFALLIPGIVQIQIIQRTLYDVLLRVVRDAAFTDGSRRRVAEVFRERFGGSMRYELEFVDKIPQERSGKYRFCVSHVATDYLRQHAAAGAGGDG